MTKKDQNITNFVKKIENNDQGTINIGEHITSTTINTQGGDVAMRDSYRIQQFRNILEAVDKEPNLSGEDREDLKKDVLEIQAEASKDNQEVDESFLARRLRNIKRMAPDILDVVTGTLVNPAAGFGVVVKKIAEKMKAEAGG